MHRACFRSLPRPLRGRTTTGSRHPPSRAAVSDLPTRSPGRGGPERLPLRLRLLAVTGAGRRGPGALTCPSSRGVQRRGGSPSWATGMGRRARCQGSSTPAVCVGETLPERRQAGSPGRSLLAGETTPLSDAGRGVRLQAGSYRRVPAGGKGTDRTPWFDRFVRDVADAGRGFACEQAPIGGCSSRGRGGSGSGRSAMGLARPARGRFRGCGR